MSKAALPALRRRLPPAHWGVLIIGVLALLLALLLHGYTSNDVGRSSTAAPGQGKAGRVPGDAPLVYNNGSSELTSQRLPAKVVALTFDDGPDPRWTKQVLDVLEREHVPATFFVVGSRIPHNVPLLRRMRRDGDDIGLHTWTHANLSAVPSWRQNLEVSLTQLALSGAVGVTTPLIRPPYSSTTEGLSAPDVSVLRRLAGRGYVIALSDLDGEDWRRPGAARIVANVTPTGDKGEILLFHDGGGDRAQTIAALPQVIESYRSRGFRFATVSSGLGFTAGTAEASVPRLRQLQGRGLLLAVRLSDWLAWVLAGLLVPLGALAVGRTLLLLVFARWHVGVAWRRIRESWWLPAVSVLVPAYNEAVGIEQSVRSLVASDYPKLEVVVIDDGSTDGTAEIVEGLGLANVTVIRQTNAGKAAALTTGIGHARYDVLVMVDGDTVFQQDTIRWLVQPLSDPRVGAVSGNTKVGNRRGLLGKWQHLEYVVGFNLDRRMYDLLRCMPTVPGAIGAFRRAALHAVGGVSSDTLAEDTDVTMAVSRLGWRIVYEERAIAWTEAPATLTALWRQRYRWCYGTMQAAWKHRGSVRDSGDGRWMGLIGLPYLIAFQVLLPLLAPIIDVYAIFGLVFLDARKVAVYWLAFLALQMVSAAYALRLDKEPLRPLWTLPLQQFVYRQLMYLVVIQSVVSALSGAHLPWHKLERTGDVVVPV